MDGQSSACHPLQAHLVLESPLPFRLILYWRGSAMQLRMSTRSMEGVLVVDCSGRVVFGEESAGLRDTVKKLLAQSPKVVLNLHEVNYIDSGGLGTLVSLYTSARNAGGAVKLASLS